MSSNAEGRADLTETDKSFLPSCVFCRIARKKMEDSSQPPLQYEDDRFVAFNDHRPASDHHLLIVPKAHVVGLKHMTASDIPMLERMEEIAKELLLARGCSPAEWSLGLHWPIHMVPHLHLHAISPVNRMPLLKRVEFNRFFYGTVQQAIAVLRKRAP